jgi:hypothetical protein
MFLLFFRKAISCLINIEVVLMGIIDFLKEQKRARGSDYVRRSKAATRYDS